MVRNDLAYKICCSNILSGYVDWDFKSRKFGEAKIGYFASKEKMKTAFELNTNFSTDKCPITTAWVGWKGIFKVSDKTSLGFHYGFGVCGGESNLKFGF